MVKNDPVAWGWGWSAASSEPWPRRTQGERTGLDVAETAPCPLNGNQKEVVQPKLIEAQASSQTHTEVDILQAVTWLETGAEFLSEWVAGAPIPGFPEHLQA